MAAVITLFTPEDKSTTTIPPESAAVLYGLTGAIWLVLAIENFRGARHPDLAWMHAILAVVSFLTMGMHLSRWRKERSIP